MHQERILRSFVLDQPKPHTPDFRIEPERTGWRVFDGEEDIAFVWPSFFDIWSFSPFEPAQMHNEEEPGKVVDLHTLHNTALNLAFHGWPSHWPAGPDSLQWEWTRPGGETLEARVSAEFDGGENIRWQVGIRYDENWGRYRYTFGIHAAKIAPDGMEPFNMMLAGALAARPENRRWTHSIWEDCDGNPRRCVHSNALFTCTDYGGGKGWLHRNIPYRGGWVGYAAHESFNPAMLVRDTTVPMKIGTCTQLFDEHLIWKQAGQENLGRDGLFHFEMDLEFVNLKPLVASRLLEAAEDPVCPSRWRHERTALPFRMGEENSFEETVDPWEPEECPILQIPGRIEGGRIQWVDGPARSGRRSIRMEADGRMERLALRTSGAVCRVQPHREYRLSGWVRTRGVERFARLELDSYEYRDANVIAHSASPHLAGDADWTRLEVTIDSGDQICLFPRMVLYGPGRAWFDDLILESLADTGT